MKAAVIAVLTAAALAPSTVWAAGDYSYKTTLDRMQDIRNTLTRWCGTQTEFAAYDATMPGEACAARFNRSNIAGVPFGFERKHNAETLTTTARWAWAFSYPDATYFVSVIDVVRHQNADRERTQDQTETYLEVVRYNAEGTQGERLTGLGAWRGRAAGKERKDQNDTPDFADYRGGIERVLDDIRRLRFAVREAYHVN